MGRKCSGSQKFRRLHDKSNVLNCYLICRSILAISILALIKKACFSSRPFQRISFEEEALDNAVADHYRSLGAVLRAKIGRSCLQAGSQQPCLRGLIATETFKPGDIVFALPIHLIHYLNERGVELDSRVAAPDDALPERLAYNFAVDVYADGAFNATHKLWFESMQRNCIANIYKATYDELSLLEMPELIKSIKKKVDSLREIHGALDGVISPSHVTWEQFLDIGYMVETRRMKIQSKQGMIPLFDYVNNAENLERADLLFFVNGTHVGFAARTHVLNGTEMRWNYKGEFQAAPDTIFINWQYVTENTSVLFSDDEQEVFKLSGTHTEMRLSYIRYIDGILGSFSTSYSQDRKDLRNTDPSSLASLFIQLRMLRKKILMAKRAELKRVLVLTRLISLSERMTSIRGFLAMVFTSFYRGLDSPT